ncbi:prepilin peptidase [Candidatus Gracilibacteria bacterium]|nr:prepilin peptidase [Candidatus Gracilibacteria bacterium]
MYLLSFGVSARSSEASPRCSSIACITKKKEFCGDDPNARNAGKRFPQKSYSLLSWLFQGGKCSYCRHKIPFFYPLVEASFISTFALFAWYFPDLKTQWPYFLGLLFALILFWYDVRFFEVDRRISFPAIILALLWAFFRPEEWELFAIGGLIGGLFYFVQYFYSKGRWVGAGDMELGVFMGLLLGWKIFLLALFASYIFGSLISLPIVIFSKKFGLKSKVPMGAFLMPSLIIFLLIGQQIWDWYMGFVLGSTKRTKDISCP